MTDTPSLDGCWAKVERANENIVNLDREIKAFINERPYEFIPDKHFKPTDDRWRQWRVTAVKSVPLRLRVLTGEIVHHLRSSLDLMVYQLIRSHSKREPLKPNRVEFPVLDTQPTTVKEKALFSGKVQGVSPIAETRIETLQPYNCSCPGDSPLYIVHDLESYRQTSVALDNVQ